MLRVIRWTLRTVAVLVVAAFVLAFAAKGFGGEPVAPRTLRDGILTLCILISLAGLATAVQREGLGAVLAVLGYGLFVARFGWWESHWQEVLGMWRLALPPILALLMFAAGLPGGSGAPATAPAQPLEPELEPEPVAVGDES